MESLVDLVSLSETPKDDFLDSSETSKIDFSSQVEECIFENNIAEEKDGRLEGTFVTNNILNLSKRVLNPAEISLLSKGLKFVPTPNVVDRAALKQDLENFGRKLRLAWHFRKDGNTFTPDPFRRKKNYNPPKNDAAIELYLSRLEEEILDINTRLKFHNISKEERQAISSLKNDTSIIIKEADKGSGIVIWDREDYLKEAESQLSDEKVYEALQGDAISPLISVVMKCLNKIRIRGDISKDTLEYFLVQNPRVGRFYLLPKIHKRLHSVPGRPVISNSGLYTENISAFLDFHLQPLAKQVLQPLAKQVLQPLAKQVKSCVQDTNDFYVN